MFHSSFSCTTVTFRRASQFTLDVLIEGYRLLEVGSDGSIAGIRKGGQKSALLPT
jgi:hypothetical protein